MTVRVFQLKCALGKLGKFFEVDTATITVKTANHTVGGSDNSLIFNCAGTCTVTLPSAASFPGRIIWLRTIANQAVVSASADVVPVAGGAAGSAILAATAGKWAVLQSDGSAWQTELAN